MGSPRLELLGQDFSARVSSWGTLEAVRKLKLSDSTLFASRLKLTLDNSDGALTPGGSGSFFPRVGWAGAGATLTSAGGLSLFDGFLWDLSVDEEAATATLDLTTGMTAAADVVADLQGDGLNPANACLALLEQAGLAEALDRASFSVAAGFFRGASIDVDSPPDKGETCLSLASQIADICSLDFFLVRGRVYCRVQRPWDGSGLRQPMDGSNCHSFRSLASDAANFANRVEFSWGAAQVATVDDQASQRAERRVISTAVDATDQAKVQVSDEASARFLAALLLSRTSPRHGVLSLTAGPDFDEVLPGQRFPVTYGPLAMARAPFEVNEARLNLDTDETETTLQTLEEQTT